MARKAKLWKGISCQNRDCDLYGELDQGNIISNGLDRHGARKFICKKCGKAFNSSHGTVRFRLHVSDDDLVRILKIASNCRTVDEVIKHSGRRQVTVQRVLENSRNNLKGLKQFSKECGNALTDAEIHGVLELSHWNTNVRNYRDRITDELDENLKWVPASPKRKVAWKYNKKFQKGGGKNF